MLELNQHFFIYLLEFELRLLVIFLEEFLVGLLLWGQQPVGEIHRTPIELRLLLLGGFGVIRGAKFSDVCLVFAETLQSGL